MSINYKLFSLISTYLRSWIEIMIRYPEKQEDIWFTDLQLHYQKFLFFSVCDRGFVKMSPINVILFHEQDY